jgi:hypothetical protein
MNYQDPQFTSKLQVWVNTPDSQKDWEEGAILLLQLSGNKIMYRNISVNPKGKAEFINGQLQKYLNFRLQKLTHDQVCDMQAKVDDIVEKVIKPAAVSDGSASGKSAEFADFKAGKRADHDDLPAEIQALYVENLDLVHRMRELHLKLRTLSLDNATCPDSERYPFLQEIIKLDKKLHENWYTYDHFIPGTQVTIEEPAPEKEDQSESEATSEEPETLVNPDKEVVNPEVLTEQSEQPAEEAAPAEAKPKKAKATAKRATKKAAKK